MAGAYVVLRKMADAGQLTADLWTPFFTAEVWEQYLIPGLKGTLRAAAMSMVLAGIFGLLFGIGRLSQISAVRWVCGVVVEFFRSVPVLIMMIFFFGVYAQNNVFSSEVNPLAAVVTGLTLYNGSVVAEGRALRRVLAAPGAVGGRPVHRAQPRPGAPVDPAAAGADGNAPGADRPDGRRAQGLRPRLRHHLPRAAQLVEDLGSAYANTVPAYIVAALLFIVMNYVLTVVASRVERRLSRRGRTTLHAVPADPTGGEAGTAGGLENATPAAGASSRGRAGG